MFELFISIAFAFAAIVCYEFSAKFSGKSPLKAEELESGIKDR